MVVAVVGAHCVVVGAVAVGGCRGEVGFLPCVGCPVLVGWGWVVVLGCGVGLLGCVRFAMCHFHSSSSSAMFSHLSSLPSRMGLCVVVVAPVDGDVLVICSVMMVGRSACRLFARAFLLVVRTPDLGRGLLIQAVMRSFGG